MGDGTERPYDPQRDSAECYNEAIRAIRHRLIRDGEVIPHEGEEIDLILLGVINELR